MRSLISLLLFAIACPAQKVYSEHDAGVTRPRVIEKAAAEYTEEARMARLEGPVLLTAIVNEDGSLRDVHVSRSLGFGLDEKAIEAVKQWHFGPGMKDGQPAAVLTHVEVNFRMLTARSDWHLTRADFETPRGAIRPVVSHAEFPSSDAAPGVVAFDVDERGDVVNTSESDLVATIKQWKFQPATLDGKPIRVHATFGFAAGPAPVSGQNF